MTSTRDRKQSWKRVVTDDGSWTLEHPVHGEACHSRAGAWLEARERYCRPCHLAELARERGSLRLLDIGTGLGLNIAAALETTRAAGVPLEVVTLEWSRDVLETAIELGLEQPSVAVNAEPGIETEPCAKPEPGAEAELHRIVLRALEEALGGTREPALLGRAAALGSLRLVFGDARATLPALEAGSVFDAIFLDPFSHSREPELWQPDFLRAVAERLSVGGWLSTYSASTRLRAGLAAGGLNVGLGPRVARKAAGTIARHSFSLPAFEPRIERRVRRAILRLEESR